MKKLIAVFMVSLIMALGATIPASAAGNMNDHTGQTPQMTQDSKQIQVQLHPVGNSGIEGLADLTQLKNQSGTHIVVLSFGLKPGDQFVSLYYGNHICQLEPYSLSDVIGGIYTANSGGVGATEGNADDNLDEINSVSVRHAGDFTLLACANVHP